MHKELLLPLEVVAGVQEVVAEVQEAVEYGVSLEELVDSWDSVPPMQSPLALQLRVVVRLPLLLLLEVVAAEQVGAINSSEALREMVDVFFRVEPAVALLHMERVDAGKKIARPPPKLNA